MQFSYVLCLINFTFNDFIFSVTHFGFNQKIIIHILDIVFTTRSHRNSSKVCDTIFGPHISYWLIVGWSVVGTLGRWSVGWWSVEGVRLVGGFKKTQKTPGNG